MAEDPATLSPDALAFLAERHLATLTTLRSDGSPHVVPVGFTWDADAAEAWVITSRASRKARHAAAGSAAALCQVDRRRWVTLQGVAALVEDAAVVSEAERRYAGRYRQPRPNPQRVVIVVRVAAVLLDSTLRSSPTGEEDDRS